MKHHLVVWFGAALALTGCALTSKSEPIDVRWFTPERVKPELTSAASPTGRAQVPAVELGHVTAGAHLREKMVYRDVGWEIGYAEDRRWTERPEAYVRRELGRTLFEERGFRRAIAGADDLVLEVELLAFEELRVKPVHAARVQLRIILHDGRDVLHEETITVDKPLASPKGQVEEYVAATADALQAASDEVAGRVAKVASARTSAR